MPRQLHRTLRAVRWRLQWIEFCRRFLWVTSAVSIALLLYVVASRLITLNINGRMLLVWVEALAVVSLVGWVWKGRVKLFDAALCADETLSLKERLSSALMIGEPKSEPEIAVLEDATRVAVQVRPSRAFPMNLKRELKFATVPLAGLALAWWFLPQMDLLAKSAEKENKRTTVTVEAKKEAAKKLDELAHEIADTVDIKKPAIAAEIQSDLTALAKQLSQQKLDGDQAMAKLATMTDKLEQRKADIEKALPKPSGMQAKGDGKFTGEMEKAIQKGNYEKAAQMMNEIKEKLKNDKLTQEEKAGLQKELKAMATKMGGDSALANSLAKAAEKMEKGEFNSALAGMEMAEKDLMSLSEMLAELKAIDGFKMDLKAMGAGKNGKPDLAALLAASQGQGQLGKWGNMGEAKVGDWKPGESDSYGNGMGGAGKGRGGGARKQEGQVGFKQSKVKSDLDAGRIIGKMKVSGEQSPGEATTQYEQLRLEYSQRAEDTIHNETLPMEFKTYVRDYFDAIKSGEAAKAEPEKK